MLWCYFPSLGTLVQEMRYANYPSSVASPLSHSPMVVFLPGRQYKLFQDGSANGPRKCISLSSSPFTNSPLCYHDDPGHCVMKILTFLIPMMTSPSLIPVTSCDPGCPAPVLKAKDGDILGFVVKLAYIGLHHDCILKTCPYPWIRLY